GRGQVAGVAGPTVDPLALVEVEQLAPVGQPDRGLDQLHHDGSIPGPRGVLAGSDTGAGRYRRPAHPRRRRHPRHAAVAPAGGAGPDRGGAGRGLGRRGAVNVAMYDNFSAREVTRVPAGTRVRFPNRGRTAHNAVAADGSWGTPDRVPADGVAAVVLDRPGVYRFYCTFHATADGRQGMAATMVGGGGPYYPGPESAGP